MSDFKFRFGTYGSNNPLYAEVRTELPIVNHEYAFKDSVNSFTITEPSYVNILSGSIDEFTSSTKGTYKIKKYGSILYEDPKITLTCPIDPSTKLPTGFISSMETYDSVNISFDYEVFIDDGRTFKVSVGTIYLKAYFVNKDSGKEEMKKASFNWHANVQEHIDSGLPAGKGTLTLAISNNLDYLVENTLSKIEIEYASGTLDTISLSNFIVNGIKGGNVGTEPRLVKVTNKQGSEINTYLCPWELKHVESISVTISGQTSTMGIPNKPASRTQIFDTGGAIRTIKISGKRYDYEENVSNWDFIYNQFNVAEDSEYKGKEYTYIGISWLLSTIQVLLKGYTFNVRSSGFTDFRYPYTTNPTLSDCIMVDSVSQLPSGAIFEGLFGYAKDVEKVYQNRNGTWWTYIPIEDTGYNVALTGFNSTFSESQPGLLDYSLTLTERFKNGNSLYNPYNPLF